MSCLFEDFHSLGLDVFQIFHGLSSDNFHMRNAADRKLVPEIDALVAFLQTLTDKGMRKLGGDGGMRRTRLLCFQAARRFVYHQPRHLNHRSGITALMKIMSNPYS